MNFGFALSQIKKGKKAAREGWNGKGQYITIGHNVSYFDISSQTIVNPEHDTMGNKVIVFHGSSGEQVGWLASQSDMLSEDWVLVD